MDEADQNWHSSRKRVNLKTCFLTRPFIYIYICFLLGTVRLLACEEGEYRGMDIGITLLPGYTV